MNLLEQVLSENKVLDAEGIEYILHSNTRSEQCDFIVSLIDKIDARMCLETGLAFGISALAICGAIEKKQNKIYYSIDPFQKSDWQNIGIENLKRENYWEFVKFYPKFSDQILPCLHLDGVELDFIYLDSTKVFDFLCVDVHFSAKLLREGGILVLDDVGYPGIQKLARLMLQQPHWKKIGSFDQRSLSTKRKFLSKVVSMLPYQQMLIAPEFDNLERENGLQAQAIAFQKVSEDTRNWDWSAKF